MPHARSASLAEPSSSKQTHSQGNSQLRDICSQRLPRRVRHIASVHVRSFNPADLRTVWPSTSARARRATSLDFADSEQQLYEIAVGFAPRSHARHYPPPIYVTDISQPCVNADWPVDPLQFSQPGTSQSGSSSAAGLAGQKNLSLSIWAREAHFAAQPDSSWCLHWQCDVELDKLEWIPGGVSL